MRPAVRSCGLVLALLGSACAGSGSSSSDFADAFSVEGALAEIPLPDVPLEVEDTRVVTMSASDLAGAAELAGVDRPALDAALGPPEFDEEYVEYTALLFDETADGSPSPVVLPPVELVLDGLRVQSAEDYRSELGWSALDIDAIIDVDVFPTTRFDVMTLRRDLEPLAARAGDDGVVDVGPGEDGERRIDDRTNLRLLGRPLRVAPDPDRGMVAVARDRP